MLRSNANVIAKQTQAYNERETELRNVLWEDPEENLREDPEKKKIPLPLNAGRITGPVTKTFEGTITPCQTYRLEIFGPKPNTLTLINAWEGFIITEEPEKTFTSLDALLQNYNVQLYRSIGATPEIRRANAFLLSNLYSGGEKDEEIRAMMQEMPFSTVVIKSIPNYPLNFRVFFYEPSKPGQGIRTLTISEGSPSRPEGVVITSKDRAENAKKQYIDWLNRAKSWAFPANTCPTNLCQAMSPLYYASYGAVIGDVSESGKFRVCVPHPADKTFGVFYITTYFFTESGFVDEKGRPVKLPNHPFTPETYEKMNKFYSLCIPTKIQPLETISMRLAPLLNNGESVFIEHQTASKPNWHYSVCRKADGKTTCLAVDWTKPDDMLKETQSTRRSDIKEALTLVDTVSSL